MIRFEIGKTYECCALYGGWLYIRVTGRTEGAISFVYVNDGVPDSTEHEAEILVQTASVYGKNLEKLGTTEEETAVAWVYHSPYAASEDDADYGYYHAFDSNRLYTPEEFKAVKAGEAAEGTRKKYSIHEALEKRKQAERDMERIRQAQDGSHAVKMQAFFAGGKYNGMTVSHDKLKEMGNGTFTIRWSQLNEHNPLTVNLKLEDQPMVDGYLSPMLDGGMLRYETQEVYDQMFN